MELKLPHPCIVKRSVPWEAVDALVASGVPRQVASIILARNPMMTRETLKPSLSQLSSPYLLDDMDKAADRVAQAIITGEIIGLETDHDCDGQTSHAVLYEALTLHFNHPKDKVLSFIGHRLEEGYGLSQALLTRILASSPRPSLVITADNGSTDEPRIAQLAAAGIDTIVTDHHEIPLTGLPPSAYAVINPTREGSSYPDPCIAGCMVAWLLMVAVRAKLIQQGWLQDSAPSLKGLLDFVAVGTVADCVSMARSHNNRAVVRYGLELINQRARPCWQAIPAEVFTAEDIGFKIGPLLNSDGRLSSALGSLSFLLTDNLEQATPWYRSLVEQNTRRKAIQKQITTEAMKQASELCDAGVSSLCIFLEEGHSGVHGISASRLKDAFGRPTILFSPKQGYPELITGSARSIDSLNIKSMLNLVAERHPDLLVAFGGHHGAAGLTLYRHNFEAFKSAFEQAVQEHTVYDELQPRIFIDGALELSSFNFEFASELMMWLEPFGREFEPPLFEVQGRVSNLRLIGAEHTHAQLTLEAHGHSLTAVWFNIRSSKEAPLPVNLGDSVSVIMNVRLETYKSKLQLKPQINHISKLTDKESFFSPA